MDDGIGDPCRDHQARAGQQQPLPIVACTDQPDAERQQGRTKKSRGCDHPDLKWRKAEREQIDRQQNGNEPVAKVAQGPRRQQVGDRAGRGRFSGSLFYHAARPKARHSSCRGSAPAASRIILARSWHCQPQVDEARHVIAHDPQVAPSGVKAHCQTTLFHTAVGAQAAFGRGRRRRGRGCSPCHPGSTRSSPPLSPVHSRCPRRCGRSRHRRL